MLLVICLSEVVNKVLDLLCLIVVMNKDVRLGERNRSMVKEGETKEQREVISIGELSVAKDFRKIVWSIERGSELEIWKQSGPIHFHEDSFKRSCI